MAQAPSAERRYYGQMIIQLGDSATRTRPGWRFRWRSTSQTRMLRRTEANIRVMMPVPRAAGQSLSHRDCHASGSLPPRYRVSDLRYRTSHSILKTSISNDSNAHSILTFLHLRYRYMVFDIEGLLNGVRYRRSHYSISKVTNLRSKVMNRVADIEVSCLRYRTNTIRYRMLISYTISKVFLTFDIEGHVITYRIRYRIRYSIHPMPFTAERKLPLPRLHHACAEESQRHVPWIHAPSFCAVPQLDPQRFYDKRSFHSATSTC
jgi:hypothetical protein